MQKYRWRKLQWDMNTHWAQSTSSPHFHLLLFLLLLLISEVDPALKKKKKKKKQQTKSEAEL